jgi:S-formylglutathione hydrolase FrmB
MRIIKAFLISAGCILASSPAVNAQADVGAAGASDMYQSAVHFGRQYSQAKKEFSFQGKSAADVAAWRAAFLPRLKQALGLAKLEAQLGGYVPVAGMRSSEDMGAYTRQRWVIWTEPTVPLPMVILIPKAAAGKRLPLVLAPHGHGRNPEQYAGIYLDEEEREMVKRRGRDVAVQAAELGYIVIAPTTRAFGETRTEKDKADSLPFSCRIQLMHDLLVGRTPIGDRVWDVSRIIDWALENLPVDGGRIAITGNSGGGTVSLFAAACDERIGAAAPSSCFSSFEAGIGTIAHCDCNYVPGMLELGEMSDVAGLVAPRRLYLINGVKDEIFPIAAARAEFRRLAVIYAAAGVPARVSLYEGAGGHEYYKEGAWPFISMFFDSPK